MCIYIYMQSNVHFILALCASTSLHSIIYADEASVMFIVKLFTDTDDVNFVGIYVYHTSCIAACILLYTLNCIRASRNV